VIHEIKKMVEDELILLKEVYHHLFISSKVRSFLRAKFERERERERERESFNVLCERIETRFNLAISIVFLSSFKLQGMMIISGSFLRFIFIVQVFEPINHSQV
jgi:hypothetical protein